MDNELLTVREVAERLRVNPTTVHRWIREGTLAVVRLPHPGRRENYRIPQSEMDKVMQPLQPSEGESI